MADFKDVTEHQPEQEVIGQGEKRYHELVDTIDGIVWEADARTFQFLFVSRQAERILGYPQGQWIEEPGFWKDHIFPADRGWAVGF